MLLYEVVDALGNAKLKYAVVGGYALALHGIVRATMDVDLVLQLSLRDFQSAEKALRGIGLQSRLPLRAADVINLRQEYIENRNLIAWSFVDFQNPVRQVDILITMDLRDLAIEKISTGGRKISVATLEQLLVLKKSAGRPQDLLDVRRIAEKLKNEA